MSLMVVGNSALTMYINFGTIEEAENLFQGLAHENHITWSAFISGLYRQKAFFKAFTQFFLMRKSNTEPNFSVALSCAASAEYHDYGCTLHALVIRSQQYFLGLLS